MSLVLCLAMATFWIRSYHIGDAVWWYGAEHSKWRPFYFLMLERAQLQFGWMTETGGPGVRRGAYVSYPASRTLHDDWVWERLPPPCRWIGVGWSSGDSTGYEIDRAWYVQVRSLMIL